MGNRAYFGMGCFWYPDDFFSKLEGVTKVRVGYAGGSQANPTYENLGDHTETVEIEFDPKAITYQNLLKHFWTQHDPAAKQKTQYRSVIFYTDKEQQKLARASQRAEVNQLGPPVTTSIEPLKKFYPAEDYHQQYYQKLRAKGAM